MLDQRVMELLCIQQSLTQKDHCAENEMAGNGMKPHFHLAKPILNFETDNGCRHHQ